MSKSKNKICCSFCGANQKQAKVLVEGDNAFICGKCIIKSSAVIHEANTNTNFNIKALKPQKIKEQLDINIIGQESVKKSVSVAVYNHYKRLINFS